ncbi:hypothetical protein DFH09DRAFT_1078554 [Mycena vulgaris]|nr:hypothetical protein DFH09DRAFT_1078554 [Mycena vulgaris]
MTAAGRSSTVTYFFLLLPHCRSFDFNGIHSSETWLDLLIGTSTFIFVWIGPHTVHLAICTDLEGGRSAENWSGATGARSPASAKTTGQRGRKGGEGRHGEQGLACGNLPARSLDLLADLVREREYKVVDFGRCFSKGNGLVVSRRQTL